MTQSAIRTSCWAFVIALSMVGRPITPRGLGQGGASQNPQQDQDKKKQSDQGGAKDNQPTGKDAKSTEATKNGDKPAPLFGGSLNVKSSRQTKDTATLGFNGVDDNGQVQKSFLSATPSGTDSSAVQKMTSVVVNPAELDDFIQQGGLNTNPPPKKSSNPGEQP